MSEVARRKPIQREHIRQRKVKDFVRDCVAVPHKFLAHDRGEARGFRHMQERARGIQKGTPDTQLKVAGIPTIWAELKAPGKEPDEAQSRMGASLQALGDIWFWTDSVEGYRQGLIAAGVPLRPNAALMAMHHDAAADGIILRAEQKRGDPPKRASKPRVEKPPASRIRKVAAVRARAAKAGVMF